MTVYAYKRCSTTEEKQDVTRQLHGKTFDEVVIEYASGKNESGRPLFQKLKEKLVGGDELHFNDLSRAGRNTKDLLNTVEDLVARGVKVVFHSESLTFVNDEQDPMAGAISKMLLTMLSSVNELFLTQNKIAIKQGLAAAKAKGIKLGAASDKYQRNPNNATKRNMKEATTRTQHLVEKIKLVSSGMVKPTFKSVAECLTKNNTPLPSGKEGVWSASQVKRVCDRFSVSIY